MIWWIAVAIILGLIVLLPFWIDEMRKPADLSQAPGDFVQLGHGKTHYRWLGPPRGPVVVAVHGLTTPSPVWLSVADALGKLGYRTLIYDLPGRGFSEPSNGLQDREVFISQLNGLLDHVGITADFTLMGYSMGGSIATAYAARNPERVARLVLVASAGLVPVDRSRKSKWAKAPIVGEWLHLGLGPRLLRNSLTQNPDHPSEVKGLHQMQRDQTRQKGFMRAVLASRRGMLSEVMDKDHHELSWQGVPVYAIWGGVDPVIDIRSVGRLAEINREAHQEVIDSADHGIGYTHGREVVNRLKDMMKDA